jgi:leucyl aminopeptidase
MRSLHFGVLAKILTSAAIFSASTGFAALGLAASPVHETQKASGEPFLVLADTSLLQEVGVEILDHAAEIGVSLARLDPLDEPRLREAAHRRGKCGGFERLPALPWQGLMELREEGRTHLLSLIEADQEIQHGQAPSETSPPLPPVVSDAGIRSAVASVSEDHLRQIVQWLSSHPSRYHGASNPNAHVDEMVKKIQSMVSAAHSDAQVMTVPHQSTRQKSIRVRILGRTKPEEMVVLGGHLDSITYDFMSSRAPGADDNASGSANILEALRVLLTQPQPERTIDLFWYAGEEGGLLGSAEIARAYAKAKNKVVGALQLDMTLFPGDGEFTLGSMTDFTSPELRQWFNDLNREYIGAKIIEDQCGYACSDHASWHSNGYRSIMPFESSFDRMFSDLHTARDVINPQMSFRHSAMFAKIAVAFALTLSR